MPTAPKKLENPELQRRRAAAAARQRAKRKRDRDSRRVFRLVLPEDQAAEFAITNLGLNPEETTIHEAVEAALQKWVTGKIL